jgi:hypothetical protein
MVVTGKRETVRKADCEFTKQLTLTPPWMSQPKWGHWAARESHKQLRKGRPGPFSCHRQASGGAGSREEAIEEETLPSLPP